MSAVRLRRICSISSVVQLPIRSHTTLGGAPWRQGELVEARVLGNNGEPVRTCVVPYLLVGCPI
jgi:hypothetical protein